MSDSGFDRLRPRRATTTGVAPLRVDPQGRQSLYSVGDQPPAPGAVTVACSSCGAESLVTPRQLVALSLPSVHLPFVKRGHSSWMRCPACDRRTWVKVSITL
jgi:uncharacterized protein with PIN domain